MVKGYFPVDTRRRFSVYKASIRRRRRRIDVLQTLKRRRVSTGFEDKNLIMAQNDSPDIVIDLGYLNKLVTVNQLIRSTDTFSFLLCKQKCRENYREKSYSIRGENNLMSPVALRIKVS